MHPLKRKKWSAIILTDFSSKPKPRTIGFEEGEKLFLRAGQQDTMWGALECVVYDIFGVHYSSTHLLAFYGLFMDTHQ